MKVLTRSVVEAQCFQALCYLAGLCDGAIEQDGRGFNGADSAFGKSLAERSRLTDKQLLAAGKMLQKYRGQLDIVRMPLPSVEDVQRFCVVENRVATKFESGHAATVINDKMPDGIWRTSKWKQGLSEQQQDAFDDVHEWFFGKSPDKFVLIGSAGTGKTYTVQRIVHSIQELVNRYPQSLQHRLGYSQFWDSSSRQVVRVPRRDSLKVGLCAPTHKAVEVLAEFAQRAELDAQIGTLHSFLHVAPGEFDADGKQKLVEVFSKSDHYSSFGLMVVDESSMIGNELLNFIPDSVPTLFMGDPAQLPPVCADVAEPIESPVFSLQPQCKLTQVMRYDGSILAMATDIRNNIECQYPPKIPAKADNLIGLSAAAWEAEMLAFFKEIDFVSNPNSIRALAYRNERVEQLNKMIRATLYPDAIERYEIGEILMANEPIFVWNNYEGREEIIMQTCQECSIVAIEHDSKTISSALTEDSVTAEILILSIESRGVMLPKIQCLRYDDQIVFEFLDKFKTAILELGKDTDKQTQKKMRASHWGQYFWLLKELNLIQKGKKYMQRLQYAYALTIHKSQGSTIQNVFADFRDIHAGRDPKTKNQLRYVALTRAAEAAFLLK